VLLPTTAWYLTGSADARRRAATLTAAAELAFRQGLEHEAALLGTRLDDLRRQESSRPFFHYQTLYRDPRGAAQGLAVTPSPLAAGTSDALIWAHFQIDETGLVTLPTVSERFPELSSDADFAAFCSLLAELQNAVMLEADFAGGTADDEQVLTLTEREWQQIRRADTVYATITGRPSTPSAGGIAATDGLGQVAIRVRPLVWKTMVLGSGPTLAALREVYTPAGIVLQGFAVSSSVVQERVGMSPLAPRFSPGPPSLAAAALVTDTGWILEADLERALAPARAAAAATVRDFRFDFAFTAAAILLAASAVLWILVQTDRLARQRAHFAAAAAHELRTPIAGLQLHAEMLAEGLGDPVQRDRYASIVSSEAARLGRVVANMLDLARLERGAQLAHPVAGELGEAVARLVERARPRLEEAGVALELALEPGLPTASFDADALHQILDNLLDNAEKHTRSVAERRVRVSVRRSGDRLAVEVRDNGPGVPHTLRRDLFRPFTRHAEAPRSPGLGVGRALARGRARAQGGELAVVAEGGEGAAFVLHLPAAR
jgi:signal transduction histidine kinase